MVTSSCYPKQVSRNSPHKSHDKMTATCYSWLCFSTTAATVNVASEIKLRIGESSTFSAHTHSFGASQATGEDDTTPVLNAKRTHL